MNIEELRLEVENLQSELRQLTERSEDRLDALLGVYFATDRNLEEYNRTSGGAEDDMRADWVIEMQSLIMQKAAAIEADSLNGVLYKLALWRWDAPDLDVSNAELYRYDALAYSAFRDLAAILRNEKVLKPCDRTNSFSSPQEPPAQLRSAG